MEKTNQYIQIFDDFNNNSVSSLSSANNTNINIPKCSVPTNIHNKHPNDSAEPRISILALGKRVAGCIKDFSSAFDLRSLGRNKFCVSFAEWSSINKNKIRQEF